MPVNDVISVVWKSFLFTGDSPVKAVFGLNLEEHLRVTDRRIAYPLELCICALTELGGMTEEGLFRIVGGKVWYWLLVIYVVIIKHIKLLFL